MQRGQPGIYMPFDEVLNRLKAPAYGVRDLVELGLFKSDHYVYAAIQNGQLKAQKINKRAVIICREHLCEYWKKYRNKPYEPLKKFTVMLSNDDIKFIDAMVEVSKKIDKTINKDCFVSLVISYARSNLLSLDELRS